MAGWEFQAHETFVVGGSVAWAAMNQSHLPTLFMLACMLALWLLYLLLRGTRQSGRRGIAKKTLTIAREGGDT